MSDRGSKNRIRLTSSETEKLVSEERKKWRVFRIQQVNHQSREHAARIKEAVSATKKKCISEVQKNVVSGWQKEKENLVEKLECDYAQCLSAVGQAHKSAMEQPRMSEVLAEQAKWNRHHAAQRGHAAGKKAKELQNEKEKKAFGGIVWRKKAIHIEKIRAKEVASLPTPEVFKTKLVSNPKPAPLVLKHEAGTFFTSAYAPRSTLVEKEVMSTFPNAKLRAKKEQKVLEAEAEEQVRENEVTKKKADERGKIALQREHTKNLYEELLRKLEKSKKDHDLSVYLQGADFNLLETEDQRLKRLEKLRENLEETVEKVLEEIESQSTLYDKTTSQSESTDLKDISDTPDYSASGITSKVEDLQDLLRKIREYEESVRKDSDGSSSGISSSGSGISGNIPDEFNVISKEEGRRKVTLPLVEEGERLEGRRKVALPVIEEDDGQEFFHERVGADILPATESTTTEMPCSSTSEDREEEDLDQDIHLAETVPVDRLENKVVDKQKLSAHRGTPSSDTTEVGECAPHKAVDSSTVMVPLEESNGTSEEGLELRIYIDPAYDTPEQSSETQVYGDHFNERERCHTAHMKKADGKEHTKAKDKSHKKQESSSSTSYLSLPSSLHAKTMDDIGADIRQLQSQRPKIQQMLDNLTSAVPMPSHSTPVTAQDVHPKLYREELKEEGSGKKLMKKKHKFEFHRREILKRYTEKLVNMKQKEVQQISASTVNSSGLTISSLGQLSSMAEKNFDHFEKRSSDSQPSSALGSVSSSSIVPQDDTEDIPTKPYCIINHNEENSHSSLTNDEIFLSQIPYDHSNKNLIGKGSTPLAHVFSGNEVYSSSLSSVEPPGEESRSVDTVENLRKQCCLVEKILEMQIIKKRLLQQQEAAIASRESPELDIQVPERDIPSSSRIKGVHHSSLKERRVMFRGDQMESQSSISSDSSFQTLPHKLGEEASDSACVEQWQQSKSVGVFSLADSMKTSKLLQRENTVVTHTIPDSGLSKRVSYSEASPDFRFDKISPESADETKGVGRITTSSSTMLPQQPLCSRAFDEPKGSSVTPEFTSWSGSESISKGKAVTDWKKSASQQDVSESLSSGQESSQRSGQPVADNSSSSPSMPDMTAVLERFGLTLS